MLNTLGEVVTCLVALAAVILVPAGIIRAWFPVIRERMGAMIMSRRERAPIVRQADITAVSIPVLEPLNDTSTGWQMPRVSAYLNDQEFVVFLARQKLKDGKYRLSANKIVDTVSLNRNEVLDIVRQVRGAPDFSNRTPEQEQQRQKLGLSAH